MKSFIIAITISSILAGCAPVIGVAVMNDLLSFAEKLSAREFEKMRVHNSISDNSRDPIIGEFH